MVQKSSEKAFGKVRAFWNWLKDSLVSDADTKDTETPVQKALSSVKSVKAKLGLENVNTAIVIILGLFWLVIFLSLFFGLLAVIWGFAFGPYPTKEEIWDWRFALAKLTALTAVLAAVVALPFTLVRLTLSRAQVETAKDALFNDKIDVAVSDLHAQRQVTRWTDETAINGWEDDITRRNGAIDRLEGLLEDDKDLAPRVSRMLSVYVREMSRKDAPAETPPENAAPEDLKKWARSLTVKRSDMETAVETLGRLPVVADRNGNLVRPVLSGANLQRFNLSGLSFEKAHLSGARLQGAHLDGAQLRGADLSGAELRGADLSGAGFDSGTSLTAATLRGAAVREVDFTDVPQIVEHLEEMFGDATVTLPKDVTAPAHWENKKLDWSDFQTAWRVFQRSIGQDPGNPE